MFLCVSSRLCGFISIRVYQCSSVVKIFGCGSAALCPSAVSSTSTAGFRFSDSTIQRLNDSTTQGLKSPPQNQLGNQVVRAVIQPDTDSTNEHEFNDVAGLSGEWRSPGEDLLDSCLFVFIRGFNPFLPPFACFAGSTRLKREICRKFPVKLQIYA